MTPDEKRTLKRIWGGGIAYQELLHLNMSHSDYLGLQAQYKRRFAGLGLGWNQRRRMWYVQIITDKVQLITNWSGNLERFLDVDTVVTEFGERIL